MIYFSHLSKKTTYTDPRLAFAIEDKIRNINKNGVLEIKQKFDASSTGMQVLQGRDLSKKYAIVTGANCGIGMCLNVSPHLNILYISLIEHR